MWNPLRWFVEPSEVRQARQQLELAESRLRLQQIHAQERLLTEARQATRYAYGDTVNMADRHWDEYTGDYGVPMGRPEDRQHGANGPWASTLEELADIRGRSRWLADRNPIAGGLIEQIENFVVGHGMTYRAAAVRGREVPAKLVAAVQACIDDFSEVNDWAEREGEIVRRAERDGECFVRRFIQDDGTTMLRFVEPEHVTEPAGCADNERFGIRHLCEWDDDGIKTEDIETVEAYHVQYAGETTGEWVDAAEIYHFRRHVDSGVKRGLSLFFATEDMIEGTWKLIRNAREGEALRAAIVGLWQYETASRSAVESHVGTIRDTGRTNEQSSVTGKALNLTKYEPGTILHVPKGKTFVPPPASPNSQSQRDVIQACFRVIGVRSAMPEYIVSSDASNANYSSTLIAGSPWSRAVRKLQSFYRRRNLGIVWDAVLTAAEYCRFEGYSADAIETLIDIQAEAPSPDVANQVEEAQVDQVDMQAGVLSRQTRRQRRGLDNDQETANLKAEPVPAQAAAFPGAGPGVAGAEPDNAIDAAAAVASPGDALRATVGGSQAIASLQTAYYGKTLPRDAAIANARIVFGFDQADAEALFPVLAPDAPVAEPVAAEGRHGFFPRLKRPAS